MGPLVLLLSLVVSRLAHGPTLFGEKGTKGAIYAPSTECIDHSIESCGPVLVVCGSLSPLF